MNLSFASARTGSSFLEFFAGDEIIDRHIKVLGHGNKQCKRRLPFAVFVVGKGLSGNIQVKGYFLLI